MLIAVEADNTEDVEVIFRKVRNKLRNCLHRSRRKKSDPSHPNYRISDTLEPQYTSTFGTGEKRRILKRKYLYSIESHFLGSLGFISIIVRDSMPLELSTLSLMSFSSRVATSTGRKSV